MTEPENTKKIILLVEDDPSVAMALESALSGAGYEVLSTDLINSGFNIFQNSKPNLVILDVDLPDGSGMDLCKKIRAHKPLATTPVILLTGHAELDSKVQGFACGADQYLTKPITAGELLLWVSALLKRVDLDHDADSADKITVGELVIKNDCRLLKYKEETIANLTSKEFELLYALVKNHPKVLSRKFILSNVWNTVAVDHLVDTHVYNLRKKLPHELAEKVQSVPGKGFRYYTPE